MAKADNEQSGDAAAEKAVAEEEQSSKEKVERREIKGGIPYTVAPSALRKSLELIIQAERPDKFTANYMATILKQTGGGARAVPPFLKKMQFIGADGTPTGLYSKFKTDGGRSQAAYEGLKSAFSELFRRNEYVHKADEAAVKDIIVEITGLKKTDQIVRLIYGSFDAVRSFILGDVSAVIQPTKIDTADKVESDLSHASRNGDGMKLGLSYQINIILPETENIAVFNAIFRSLRENLLR